MDFFNRKSTAFQQALHKLEERLEAVKEELNREKSQNRRNLLEFAELGEKMRRLYLRLSRLKKIESEATSSENEPNDQNDQQPTSAKDVREAINQQFKF